ncbi:MAG: hypothetical protein AAF368_00735 [Planctomycetota bacterium]
MAARKGAQAGARGRRKAGFKPDVLTNPEARGDAVFGALYGALRPLDEMAAKMESKWGNDRLETLVTPETCSKFCAVRERLNAAIDEANVQRVTQEATILYRGWIALDLEASRLGAEPMPSNVWSITGDDAKQYRITLTDEDKFGLCAHLTNDEAARVLSVEELLRIYASERMSIVKAALEEFPGAYVSEVRPKAQEDGGPLFETAAARGFDDEIPF